MTKIKRIIASLLVSFGFVLPALVPAVASAQDVNRGICAGANLSFAEFNDTGTDPCEGDDIDDAGTTIDELIVTIVNILSLVVGVISVIMIIIGGLRYITSNGDSGNVTNAKNTILYAIVGLVIVALAQLVVRFVAGRLNSAVNSPGE